MSVKLQGSYTGVKKYKEMKNPDILYSKIDKGEICKKNKITISKKGENRFYVYHMYDSIDSNYSGRWYDTQITKDKLKFNDTKLMVTYIIPEYDIKKNVEVEIYFTPKGYKKLLKTLGI
jgi:hypothetical protein